MHAEEVDVALDALGERYGELRLVSPEGERDMQRSLERFGQMSPIVVTRMADGTLEVVDGVKRLHAARRMQTLTTLRARVLTLSPRAAKAAVLCLNWVARTTCDLEEALVVRSLVREDGLSQVEVAELLSRDKSWVCRRLALVERLSEEAQGDLRLGLMKATVGRELARLPRGNQTRVMESIRTHKLGSRAVAALVDLLHDAPAPEQARLLREPLLALAARHAPPPTPAQAMLGLGPAAAQMQRDLAWLEAMGRQVAATLHGDALCQLPAFEQTLVTRPMTQALRACRQAAHAIELALAAVKEARHDAPDRP